MLKGVRLPNLGLQPYLLFTPQSDTSPVWQQDMITSAQQFVHFRSLHPSWWSGFSSRS